jgi:hypothetical protein
LIVLLVVAAEVRRASYESLTMISADPYEIHIDYTRLKY